MQTITIPAKTVCVYSFNELSDEAKERAIDIYAGSAEYYNDIMFETQDIFDAQDAFCALFDGLTFEWDSWNNCYVRSYPEVDAQSLPRITDSWAQTWAEYTILDIWQAHYQRLVWLANQLERWAALGDASLFTKRNKHAHAREEHYYKELVAETRATFDAIAKACANDCDAQCEYMCTVDWFAEMASNRGMLYTADGNLYTEEGA